METTIQNILKLQGKQKQDAPGTEWFITSPSEVEQVYEEQFWEFADEPRLCISLVRDRFRCLPAYTASAIKENNDVHCDG